MAPHDPLFNSAVIDWLEVEKAVDAFESARGKNRTTPLRDHLPPPDHPLFERVLREMIRIELEDSWSHGRPLFLDHYRNEYPFLFKEPEGLGDLAFEEYRLRRLAGDSVDPSEYATRYGLETADWPLWDRATSNQLDAVAPAKESEPPQLAPRNPSLEAAAQSYLRLRLESDSVSVENLDSWRASCTAEPEKAAFFCDLHISSPEKASLLAEGLSQLPEAGTEFLGFRLLSELGRGAFGRVYLAKQGDLAGRWVALKVAADVFDESQSLAKLQHTNIVPIYSIHKSGKLQAVCMPYFGNTTLADVLSHVESQPSMPDSGKFVVSTLNNRRGSTQRKEEGGRIGRDSARPSLEEPASRQFLPEGIEDEGLLQQLAGYSYVQAVLWMSSQLADGLHHAHQRGILHRDLKPANILLTDEGQPMLLDFNLSADLKSEAHRATVGGTLPYMAPEHLEAFRGRQQTMDARSDLYALGIMMYELLAGKRPFPTYRGESDTVLSQLIADRMKGTPGLRQHNSAVTPAMEAIVAKCLAPKLEDRYKSAGELHEDLVRQLKNLPLKHIPEPSLGERARKWVRRHPRAASTTTIGTAAAVLIVLLGAGLILRDRQAARLEASENWRGFNKDLDEARFLLYSQHQDANQLRQGDAECRRALSHYGLPENADWESQPSVRNLPAQERERLRSSLGELLLLLGKNTSLQADFYATPQAKGEKLLLAMNLNSLAESCYDPENAPRALFEQRGDLAKRLGKDREAQAIAALLRDFKKTNPKDDYLAAHKLVIDGNYREALGLLRRVTQDEPDNFPAWFVRGSCYHGLVRESEAIGCFNVCVALRPNFAQGWLDRGLCHIQLKNFRQAADDFSKVIDLQPDSPTGFINRAKAREHLNNLPGALADLNSALNCKDCPPRVYFARAGIRRKLDDQEGADKDMARCLEEAPQNDEDWMTRGFARINDDPLGALADFDEALKLNPRSFEALQNKGALLSNMFHQDDASLEVMDDAVKLYPDSALTRGGRGVLLARLGDHRKEALADAEEALLVDNEPSTLYQVACIYALTSQQDKNDQAKALQLLSAAIRTGFGLDMIETDSDLDPIRQLPQFKKLVEAARALAGGAAPAKAN